MNSPPKSYEQDSSHSYIAQKLRNSSPPPKALAADIAVIRSYGAVACLPPFVHAQTLLRTEGYISSLQHTVSPVTKGGAMEMDDELLRSFRTDNFAFKTERGKVDISL